MNGFSRGALVLALSSVLGGCFETQDAADASTATATVGAAGGTVATADGLLSLTVPAGAVVQDTAITIRRLPDAEIPNAVRRTRAAAVIELQPSGTVFAVPLTLEIDGSGIDVTKSTGSFAPMLIPAVFNDDFAVGDLPKSTTISPDGSISLQLDHFSTVVVAQFDDRFRIDQTTSDQIAEGETGELQVRLLGLAAADQQLGLSAFQDDRQNPEADNVIAATTNDQANDGADLRPLEIALPASEGESTRFSRSLLCQTFPPGRTSHSYQGLVRFELGVPGEDGGISGPDAARAVFALMVSTSPEVNDTSGDFIEFLAPPARVDCVGPDDSADPDPDPQPENRPPVANPDTLNAVAGFEETLVAPGVLANDSDPDGDSITARIVSGPTNGTATLDSDGSVSYTGDAGFAGTDQISYRAVDEGGAESTPSILSVIVTENQAPIAGDDSLPPIDGDETASFILPQGGSSGYFANDSDPDGQPIRLSVANLVSGGGRVFFASLNEAVQVGYQIGRSDDCNSTVQISYSVTDERHGESTARESNTATISFAVQCTNLPLRAIDDSYTGTRGDPLVVDGGVHPGLLENDENLDTGAVTLSVVTPPTNGEVDSLGSDGSFRYTPASGDVTGDSFEYEVRDGTDEGRATVTISLLEAACENEVTRDIVTFDQGAACSGGVSFEPGSTLRLDELTLATVFDEEPGFCELRHLHGNGMRIREPEADCNEPPRDQNDALGEFCGYGEVTTVTECIDPQGVGSIPAGRHPVVTPSSGVAVRHPITDLVIAGDSFAGDIQKHDGPQQQSVVFADVGPVFGPLVFPRIPDGSLIDLGTGTYIDIPGVFLDVGPLVIVSEGQPGPDARAWALGLTAFAEIHPDVAEPIRMRSDDRLFGDVVPFGFTGNFAGGGFGFLDASQTVAIVYSFAVPNDVNDVDFNNRSNAYVVFRPSNAGFDGNIQSASAVAAVTEPALLVVEEGSPSRLWHFPAGDPASAQLIGSLGNGPGLIRCLDAQVCAVVNSADQTLTTIRWDGVTAPSIVDTVVTNSDADRAALYLHADGLGFQAALVGSDGVTNVIDIAADGTVGGSRTYPADPICEGADKPVWFRDTEAVKLMIPCTSSGFDGDIGFAEFVIVQPEPPPGD